MLSQRGEQIRGLRSRCALGGSSPLVAAAVAVVVVRNRAVHTRIRNHSEHHSVPVVSGVVSAVVSAVSVVSYNVSQVFSVH